MSIPHVQDLPLSRTRRAGDFVFVSGVIGLDASRRVPEDFRDEVELAVERLQGFCHDADVGLDQIVQMGLFIKSHTDFPIVNEVLARHLKPPYPARTTVVAGFAAPGIRFEVDAVAWVG